MKKLARKSQKSIQTLEAFCSHVAGHYCTSCYCVTQGGSGLAKIPVYSAGY
ncbi:MAG: hypothetical protein N3I35_06530 [Clostridia bacterium]|nr:hypothetical protein [Clostridia bacterium]